MDNKYVDVRAIMNIDVAGGHIDVSVRPDELYFDTIYDICGFMNYLWNDMIEDEKEMFMEDANLKYVSTGKEKENVDSD